MRSFLTSVWLIARADLIMFLRYPANLVGAFLWPILFTGSAVLVARGLAGPENQGIEVFATAAGTADYVSYLILGNIFFATMNLCLWGGGLSLSQARQQGVLETHWLLPGRGLAFVFGKTLSSIIQQLLPSLALVAACRAAGLLAFETNVFAVSLLLLLSMPFLLAALVLFATLTLRVAEGGYAILSLRTVVALICGVSFPLSVLPGPMQTVGHWFPLTQMLEVFRRLAIFGDPLSAHAGKLAYILVWGIVALAAALAVFRFVDMRVRKAGLLGGH